MAYPDIQTPGSFEHGMIANLRALLGVISEYLSLRLQLIGLESKSAIWHYLKIIIAAVVSLALLAIGGLYASLSIVYVIALKVGWGWALLITALVLFIIAVGALLWAKTQLLKPMFETTIAELKKDREWLAPKK